MIAFAKPDNIIAMPTKNNEWFTPVRYVDTARRVMGSIDLDPASCFEANQTVRAKRYYTKEENGLTKKWYGNVWLNPPYCKEGHSGIGKWTQKLLNSYFSNDVMQAILLVAGQTASRWFLPLWEYPICFASTHIRFYRPGLVSRSQRDCTCFIYLGPNNEKFAEVFSEFGPVIPANAAVRRQQITPLSLWEVTP